MFEIIGHAQVPPQIRGQRGTAEAELRRRRAVKLAWTFSYADRHTRIAQNF